MLQQGEANTLHCEETLPRHNDDEAQASSTENLTQAIRGRGISMHSLYPSSALR